MNLPNLPLATIDIARTSPTSPEIMIGTRVSPFDTEGRARGNRHPLVLSDPGLRKMECVVLAIRHREDDQVFIVHLDAGNLASGVFFYRIQAGDFAQTRKVCLIK